MAETVSQECGRVPGPFTGVIAPMYTPVHPDGSLDLEGTSEMVRWLGDCGCVRSVFARSGMGKMFTFTVEETRTFARAVRAALPAGMGMLLAAGGEWLNRDSGGHADEDVYTAQAIELTRFAAEIGCAGAVHVLPAAIAPRAGETHHDVVYRYFRTVHDATDTPILLYQPGGMPEPYRLSASLLARLVELPRIAGLKLSTTDDAMFDPLAEVVRDSSFALICGHEGYYAVGLCKGAVGVIGQGCNGYPEILAAVDKRHRSGDAEGARRAQDDVWAGLRVTDGLDSSVALKQYFARHGYRIGPWDRGGKPPYDDAVMDRVQSGLDALRRPYRQELALGPMGRL
ncbi:MAG: dihydrodipicolinate synthase family protein [Chthonomonadales bacterium]|nr:dihydrodipicolinate synthase family protein [Chthonomonadales bacterium]